MANRFLHRDEQQSLEELMTSTDFNRNEIEAPAEPGSIGAGAEIYRRMERRGKRRPMWMTAAPIVALAVVAAGGVVAYEAMKPNTAPKPPVQAQAMPAAAPAQVAATPPAPAPAAAPTPAAPVRVVHEVKVEHVRPAVTPVAHRRTVRDANSAASASEDTSAHSPAPQPMVRPAPTPAQAPAPTVTAPPVAVTPAPAPVTASPPAASAAPSDSSQTTPAPQ
jgi:hypothetical protein